MKCTKTYTLKSGKRITVSWCLLGGLTIAMAIFVIVERIYGPF